MRTSLMRLPDSRDGKDPIATLIATVRQAREWGFDRYWVPQLPGLRDVALQRRRAPRPRQAPGVDRFLLEGSAASHLGGSRLGATPRFAA